MHKRTHSTLNSCHVSRFRIMYADFLDSVAVSDIKSRQTAHRTVSDCRCSAFCVFLFCFFASSTYGRLVDTFTFASMNFQTDPQDRAVLLVVGRTRIGKSEFISTANRIFHGSRLPDIVSDGLLSHTKKTQGYPMRLGDKDVSMVDTVGIDDIGETDIPDKTLLQFLAHRRKADFYPPLVMIQALSRLEIELLTKMASFFTDIVVALRMDNRSTFDINRKHICEACQIRPIVILPLQTFMSSGLGKKATQCDYQDGVSTILSFYRTLTPSKKLPRSPLFVGSLEKTLSLPETKSEVVEEESRETRRITRGSVLVRVTQVGGKDVLYEEIGRMPVAVLVLALPSMTNAVALFGAILGRKEKIRYVEKQREVDELFKIVTKIRRTYEREVQAVWKILAGDSRGLEGYEYGPWEIVDDEVVARSETKVSSVVVRGE